MSDGVTEWALSPADPFLWEDNPNFGEKDPGKAHEVGAFRMRVGDRPIARNLRRLYELQGKQVPPELDIFTRYDLWLVSFYFSAVGTPLFDHVSEMGMTVDYTGRPPVTVTSVFPTTKFVQYASTKAEVDISISGQADAKAAGGAIKAEAGVDLAASLSINVMSPSILAVGAGSSNSEWIFSRTTERPLEGEQEVGHVVLARRGQRKLECEVQLRATVIRKLVIPSRWSSPVFPLSIELSKEG